MYAVRLEDFEGPLDLLLFFIKRDELDIYNIPISRITKEFLDYIRYLESLDLEVAGEFMVVAAELMQIKSKMLLPPERSEDEELDPRLGLVQRLIEYRRFKEMAVELQKFEEERQKIYTRSFFDADPKVMKAPDERELLKDFSVMDLVSSFKRAIAQMPKVFVHEVARFNVTIDEMIGYILEFFRRRSETTFVELTEGFQEKLRVVVTFVALLELTRSSRLVLRQQEPFGTLSIMRKVGTETSV